MNKKVLPLILFFVTAGLCAGVMGYVIVDKNISKNEIISLQESAYDNKDVYVSDNEIADKTMDGEQDEGISSEEEVEITYESPIDFQTLQESNPDIFAWINIPGSVVDYPIVQHPTDDSYYLSHGPEGLYSAYGCPYIELSDSGTFLEFNTVIYGHNMKDGSMFASLHDYEDEDYFNSHREISIYTPDHAFTYEVFAAVMYSDAHIPYYYDDLLESDRTEFLKSLKEDCVPTRSYFADDMDVTEDDCIITLSTCDKKLRDNRFLVIAALKQIDGQDA